MRLRFLSLALLTFALSAHAAGYDVHLLPLSKAMPGGVSMDYLVYDPHTGFVWAPAGNSGRVDVVDTATGKLTPIADFPTAEIEARGRKRVVGPSSATVGDGVVYVGNRGDFKICAIDAKSLARGACGHIDSMPDGLAYSATTKDVWVTAPRDKSIRILDAKTLAEKAKLTYEGNPEGFAVDGKRGRFYTNMEDKDRTLAIDLKTHKTVATWSPACGGDGPHGLRLDEKAGLLFVACDAKAEVLDVAHDGKVLSSIETGDGVDDLDYAPATRMLYVAAAKAARLTIAHVDNAGHLTLVATVPTHAGARNGVVAKDGSVYLGHGGGADLSELVVVTPTK